MTELVKYSVQNHIATIILDDPKSLNAFGTELSKGLLTALDNAQNDDTVRAIILEGAGGNFSSGGHIKEMLSVGTEPEALSGKIEQLVDGAGVIARKLRSISKPTIAKLQGAVAGAGFNLALTCDFRVASNDAKFVQSFINIGLVPDAGGLFLLNQLIGTAKATEFAMLGEKVSAEQAYQLNLINKLVSSEELDQAVNKLATHLVHLPATALATIKQMINQNAYAGFDEHLNLETKNQAKLAKSDDFIEGVSAFVEKRLPNYLKVLD